MDVIKACAWCGRVRLKGWLEADEAIRVLRSYDWPEPPRFSHGICDDCFQQVMTRRTKPACPEEAAA